MSHFGPVETTRTTHGFMPDLAIDQLYRDIGPQEVMVNQEAVTLLEAYRHTGNTTYRDRIVAGNLRLITKLAHRYRDYRPGIEFADLVQASMEGFIIGLDKYKWGDDACFSPKRRRSQLLLIFTKRKVAAYAANYAIKYILKFVEEEAPTVKIGRKAMTAARKGYKASEKWMREYEASAPALDLILSEMGHSATERIGALDVYANWQSSDTISEREDAPDEDDGFERRFNFVCDQLTPWEREVVFAKFGIDGLDFKEVCKKRGITQTRGREIVQELILRIGTAASVVHSETKQVTDLVAPVFSSCEHKQAPLVVALPAPYIPLSFSGAGFAASLQVALVPA